MKKTLSVTVGIPAYNEEKNIIRLIQSVKAQDKSNYKLEKIVVYSDGSSDNTASLIRKNFEDVKVYDFKENKGKLFRLNQIVGSNSSDILVLLDADIKIKDKNTISEIVTCFKKQKSIGLVCACHRAEKPHNFVGQLAHFGYRVWDRARDSIEADTTLYFCEGGMLALSQEFAKKYRIPSSLVSGDDWFAFFSAVNLGFKVVVARRAQVFIDLPATLKDYMRQMSRFLSDPGNVEKYFEKDLVDRYEVMSTKIKLRALFSQLTAGPFTGLFYCFVQGFTRLLKPFQKQKVGWVHIERR